MHWEESSPIPPRAYTSFPHFNVPLNVPLPGNSNHISFLEEAFRSLISLVKWLLMGLQEVFYYLSLNVSLISFTARSMLLWPLSLDSQGKLLSGIEGLGPSNSTMGDSGQVM